MIQLHIYGILAILELLLVVGGLSFFLFVRNRSNHRRIARLQNQLSRQRTRTETVEATPSGQATTDAAPVQSYSDFLKDELDSSSIMLGNDSGAETDAEAQDADDDTSRIRSMLAARHQFLQLELDAQAMSKDPQSKREHLVQSMEGLLATLASLQPEAEESAGEAETQATEDAEQVAKEKQLESQIAHLRDVIDNQHEVMRELRELLEKEAGQSEELQVLVRKLQDAEAQSVDLSRSLEYMEKEAGTISAQGGSWQSQYESVPDADMLRDLVGNQQQTITRLQGMLKENIADDSATTELRDAMEKIQRSNQELGTCVMVLEDENTMLRDQIDSLRSQLDGLDSGDDQDETVSSDRVSEAIDALPDAAPADSEEAASGEGGDASGEEDIEALIAAEQEPEPDAESESRGEAVAEDAGGEAPGEAADNEVDIDALIEAGGGETHPAEPTPGQASAPDAQTETASESMAQTSDTEEAGTAATEAVQAEPDATAAEEVEDIDAPLNATQADTASAPAEQKDQAASSQDDDEINTLQGIGLGEEDDELSNDDIDALLNGTNDKKAE